MANDCKYKFSDKAPKHIIYVNNESGVLVQKEVVGVTPFGKHSGILTEDKLTDAIAEYLISKNSTSEPYGSWIVAKKGDK